MSKTIEAPKTRPLNSNELSKTIAIMIGLERATSKPTGIVFEAKPLKQSGSPKYGCE